MSHHAPQKILAFMSLDTIVMLFTNVSGAQALSVSLVLLTAGECYK